MNNNFLELLLDGEIQIEMFEHEGQPMLNIEYVTPELKASINEDEFTAFVSECLAVATMCGFEAPTDYYKAMKEFVQEKTMEDLEKDMLEAVKHFE